MIFLRTACQEDLLSLSAIWYENRLVQQQYDLRIRLAPDAQDRWCSAAAEWLIIPDMQVLVYEKDDRVLGYIVGRVELAPPGLLPEQLGVVLELNADLHARESGVGSQLLHELRSWFLERGINQVVARTIGHSVVEHAFWRAQGAADWMAWLWLKS